MSQTIGIVGLGLIGASLAKSLQKNTEDTILGWDIDENTMRQALTEGTIDASIEDYSALDLLIVALFPKAAVDFIETHISQLKKGCIVMDICGVKKQSPHRLLSCVKVIRLNLSADIRWREKSVGVIKTQMRICFAAQA